jgi:hypothetical protein
VIASILQFLLRPKTLLTAGIALLVYVIFGIFFVWTDQNIVTARQERLFHLLSSKRWEKCGSLLSEDYRDNWDFSKTDAVLALKDIGSQFMIFHIEVLSLDVSIGAPARSQATADARVRLSGSGSPFCQQVISEANRLKEPFHFTWQKESWHPWSWHIIRIEQNELPPDLHGYRPGDLNRALRGAADEAGIEMPSL